MCNQLCGVGTSASSRQQLAAGAECYLVLEVDALGFGCGEVDVDVVAVRVPDVDLHDRRAGDSGDPVSFAVALQPLDESFQPLRLQREVLHRQVALLLGDVVASMSDDQLAQAADATTVFAKLTPSQKARVIVALQRKGHVVGFLGDGINDSPALKAADVGISVDTAVDIAKESADIILLEKNLLVLETAAVEGRRTFINITKYIRMGASSNFGNMFSVIGASIVLPFLPMAPIQVLTNNLLYDFSQSTIPTDNVDEESLATPRRWDISNIFKFMIIIGPISSIFDYATFGLMLFVFDAWSNPALFQTGWFVESLLTQTLIIHIIRTTRIPFIQSHASPALMSTTVIISAIGVSLPFTWAGSTLGFIPLPPLYWPLLAIMLMTYAISTHIVKVWFVKHWMF